MEQRRRRYCGILSVPFNFEAPDLGAAVARMMKHSLPGAASASSTGEDGADGEFSVFEPAEASEEEENVFGLSAPRATAGAARGLRQPLKVPLPSSLLPRLLRGQGRTASARHRRRRPLLSRAAASAVALPFLSCACARSFVDPRWRVL